MSPDPFLLLALLLRLRQSSLGLRAFVLLGFAPPPFCLLPLALLGLGAQTLFLCAAFRLLLLPRLRGIPFATRLGFVLLAQPFFLRQLLQCLAASRLIRQRQRDATLARSLRLRFLALSCSPLLLRLRRCSVPGTRWRRAGRDLARPRTIRGFGVSRRSRLEFPLQRVHSAPESQLQRKQRNEQHSCQSDGQQRGVFFHHLIRV